MTVRTNRAISLLALLTAVFTLFVHQSASGQEEQKTDRWFVNGSHVGKPYHGVIVARIQPVGEEHQDFPNATETLVVVGPIGGSVTVTMRGASRFLALLGPATQPITTGRVEFRFRWLRFGHSSSPMGITVYRPDGTMLKEWIPREQRASVLLLSAHGGQNLDQRQPFNITAGSHGGARSATTSRELGNVRVTSQYGEGICPLWGHAISLRYRLVLAIQVRYFLRVRNVWGRASYSSWFEGAGTLFTVMGFQPPNINPLVAIDIDRAYAITAGSFRHQPRLHWEPAQDILVSAAVGREYNYIATLGCRVETWRSPLPARGVRLVAEAITGGWDGIRTVKMVPLNPLP